MSVTVPVQLADLAPTPDRLDPTEQAPDVQEDGAIPAPTLGRLPSHTGALVNLLHA
eukprot:COSAG01_NODE_10144_length_2237_cov_3.904584_2_plen_56_part_00